MTCPTKVNPQYPTAHTLHLTYGEDLTGSEVVLMHVTGKVYGRLLLAVIEGKAELDVSHLPNGSYQLLLQPQEGKPVVKQFVILR